MSELKPCPKCQSTDVGASQGKAYCYNCGIQTTEFVSNGRAVKNWNTRTESTELEQLRKERDELLQELCDIQGMCIGELTMGYKLDAGNIGCGISKVTGMTHPELLAKLNKQSGE